MSSGLPRSSTIENLKTEFLQYIEIEKGRSLSTVSNYDHYLSRFIDFSKAKEPDDITDDVLRQYRLWLNRQEGRGENQRAVSTNAPKMMKKRTQNYYLIALRAFLKYITR